MTLHSKKARKWKSVKLSLKNPDPCYSFWVTVCKTVCPMLSDRCPVCLSVRSLCDVGVLWPNGWTDQDETWHGGRFGPGHTTGLTTGCIVDNRLYTRYSRLRNRLYNPFDNRLYRVNGVIDCREMAVEFNYCKAKLMPLSGYLIVQFSGFHAIGL